MTDWETRMSDRAKVRTRRALTEEHAEIPPMRQYAIPVGSDVSMWSALVGEGEAFVTADIDGKKYRIIP